MLRCLLVALLVLAGCRSEARPPDERVITLVVTAEVQGTPEPCGCNADTLGDVARVVALAKGGLLLDAGGLLYGFASSGTAAGQADLKASALAHIYGGNGAEVGLGKDDLQRGAAKVVPARQAFNCAAPLPTVAPVVRELEGVKIGIFGVAQPARVAPTVKASDPVVAAKQAVAQLRKQGAQVIVALLGMSRAEARDLLGAVTNDGGIQFAIAGAEVGDGMVEAEPVGGAFLVAPADQARKVAKLELHVKKGDVHLQKFAGAAAQKVALDRTQKRITTLMLELEGFRRDPHADRNFVAAREAELKQLQAKKTELETSHPEPPPTSYFTYELQPVRPALPRDPKVAAQLKQMYLDIGQHNLQAAKNESPPPAEPGKPHYVGRGACESCHKSEVAFWQKTMHASAWQSLVDVGKQYDYDCISCHVTGWDRPGGSLLGTVEKQGLVNVQCEVCHGPGSKHVEEEGLESPSTMIKSVDAMACAQRCHTKEHSDTFQLVPYLRDILGKGHGEKKRLSLGDGVTGHELKQKALQAVGRK